MTPPKNPPRPDGLPRAVAEQNVSRAPHTPVPRPDDSTPTAPPPAMPMSPPRGLEGPRARFGSRPDPQPTLTGLGPPTVDIERQPERAPASLSPPRERAERKRELHAALLKLLAALTTLCAGVSAYVAVAAHGRIEPRVDRNAELTKAVESSAASDHEELLALREYVRAESARLECLAGQMASALRRGTGHRIPTLDDTEWLEQSLPGKRPALLWDRAVWYPLTPCGLPPKAP